MSQLAFHFRLVVCIAFAAVAAQATNLTGTFKHPDGSLVNGKLILRLSQPAKLSDNSAQIVPLVKIFNVTNGALEAGAFVYGNDALVPTGTYYVARLVDANNNLLFEQKWSITGTSLDLGTLTPTTTGVVLADPLVRNVVTSQVVQGPVTFAAPLTAFSLVLNGNFNPGTATAYDMGNPAAPWREVYMQRWNGNVAPASSTALLTDPATAPTVATEATSGGSLDNSTRYIRVGLLTLNGETLPSPVATYTPTACSGGACKLGINLAGQEWYQGAFAFRVYACTDATGTTCHRQSGFPDEIDSTGPLANAHYSPGTVILSSISMTGPAPASTNAATIDADQVAVNTACFSTTNICSGTVQYKQNPSSSAAAQVGTTPLVLARAGTRVRGHGSESIDLTAHGSTRKCDFTSLPATTQVKLGCVMIMNVNGVDVEALNVSATGANAVMLTTWGSSFNMIRWAQSSLAVTGALALAPIRIQGIWYYLDFDRNQLYAGLSGTGANKGAGVLISNASGASWRFSGKSRWTINTFADAIRNDLGKTDRDRATSATFPSIVGEVKWEDVQVQWSPQPGSPQGQLVRGGGLALRMDGVTHSDYSPASGTGPLIEVGYDADGAAACCKAVRIANSTALQATGNNSAWLKNVSTAAGGMAIEVDGVNPNHNIDLNNQGGSLFVRNIGMGAFSCNANAAAERIVNATNTQAIYCDYAVNNGITADRISNVALTGGFTIHDDSNRANARYWYWPTSNTLAMYLGDPTVAANQIVQYIGGKRTAWMNNAGSSVLLDIDARSGVDVVQVGGQFRPDGSGTRALGSGSLRWAGLWSTTADFSGVVTSGVATGTAPFAIASATEVANLNAQKWHGKDAIDFSATLDFGSIAAQACAALTITAAGAATDNAIAPSWPAALEAGLTGMMHVTAADTITVRLCNVTASAIDPASRTYGGRVIK